MHKEGGLKWKFRCRGDHRVWEYEKNTKRSLAKGRTGLRHMLLLVTGRRVAECWMRHGREEQPTATPAPRHADRAPAGGTEEKYGSGVKYTWILSGPWAGLRLGRGTKGDNTLFGSLAHSENPQRHPHPHPHLKTHPHPPIPTETQINY